MKTQKNPNGSRNVILHARSTCLDRRSQEVHASEQLITMMVLSLMTASHKRGFITACSELHSVCAAVIHLTAIGITLTGFMFPLPATSNLPLSKGIEVMCSSLTSLLIPSSIRLRSTQSELSHHQEVSLPESFARCHGANQQTSWRPPSNASPGRIGQPTVSVDWNLHPPKEIFRKSTCGGEASFIAAEDRIYTIEQCDNRERVTCNNLADGKQIWEASGAKIAKGLDGHAVTAPPALEGNRLFVLGAMGDLRCLSARDGKVIWQRDVLSDAVSQNLQSGIAGTPLIFHESIIVAGSGIDGPGIMAFDKDSGLLQWNVNTCQQVRAPLLLAKLGDTVQVVNLAASILYGIDPTNGKIMWGLALPSKIEVSFGQISHIGDLRVFIGEGYGGGCALVQTFENDPWRAREIWIRREHKFSTSVKHLGRIYGLDHGVLTCLALTTGTTKFRGANYGNGSMLLLGNNPDAKLPTEVNANLSDAHLLILSEKGSLILIKLEPTGVSEVGTLQILGGGGRSDFIIVGSRLLARNKTEMVCYDLSPEIKNN
jgi:outer membrane protein assembly factor BamB